jgi:hypothetical protein
MTEQPYPTKQYCDDQEVEMIAVSFESCAIQPSEFSHGAHLSVALWYLSKLTFAEATERMRTGLDRFLSHHGVGHDKYNETITVFWLKLVESFQRGAGAHLSLAETANRLLETFGNNSKLVFDYYSRERLMSEEAKKVWIEPDLKPLDF